LLQGSSPRRFFKYLYIRIDALYSNANLTSRFQPAVRLSSREIGGIAQGQREIIEASWTPVKRFLPLDEYFFLITFLRDGSCNQVDSLLLQIE
jgi:hypothetical protein